MKIKYYLLFLVLISYIHGASSVSQYGITWTFDHNNYQVGQFANGDWWVVGPVTISSITPDFDGSNNGWEVNPVVSGGQGFQDGCDNGGPIDRSLVPALPYTASSGESIVKTIASGSARPCIRDAAVLTVLGSIPPENGATVFRPPYVGDEKPLISINDLRTDLLPSLAPVSNTPSLSSIQSRFQRVQLDHKTGRIGRMIRPINNMHDYQPDNAQNQGDGALRLMLNDPISEKLPALIAYVQMGIDAHYMVKIGQTWPAGGGYQPGHKLVAAFTATILDIEEMKNQVMAPRESGKEWNEDAGVYRSPVTNMVLFGFIPPRGSEKTQWDPHHYIDGGNEPGGNYQFCCLSQPWKGEVLAVRLMPAMQQVWYGPDYEELLEYVDRWVSVGTWTLPDPYNRFPEKHGTQRDDGYRYSNFQAAMWDAYRNAEIKNIAPPQGLEIKPILE